MGLFRFVVAFACISLVGIIFTVLSGYVLQVWLFHRVTIAGYKTNDTTSTQIPTPACNTTSKQIPTPACNTTSKQIPTSACKGLSVYEHLGRKSQNNNFTLCVIPKRPAGFRLGNQMFKYASLLGIARAQGRCMFYHPNTDVVHTFKVTHVAVNQSSVKWPVIYENQLGDEKLMNLPMHNVKIDGFLQSFLYFAAIMDEVRQEFTFHDSIANAAGKILHNLHVKYNSSMIVGVHVRRGDFLRGGQERRGYKVPEKSYFMKAFSLMRSKFSGRNITFLVASDDLTWCNNNLLGNDVSIMPPAHPSIHLAALASCDHMIISGGTFGWWSGWLANGYVIYYTGYMKEGTHFGDWYTKDRYYPRMWIGLEN